MEELSKIQIILFIFSIPCPVLLAMFCIRSTAMRQLNLTFWKKYACVIFRCWCLKTKEARKTFDELDPGEDYIQQRLAVIASVTMLTCLLIYVGWCSFLASMFFRFSLSLSLSLSLSDSFLVFVVFTMDCGMISPVVRAGSRSQASFAKMPVFPYQFPLPSWDALPRLLCLVGGQKSPELIKQSGSQADFNRLVGNYLWEENTEKLVFTVPNNSIDILARRTCFFGSFLWQCVLTVDVPSKHERRELPPPPSRVQLVTIDVERPYRHPLAAALASILLFALVVVVFCVYCYLLWFIYCVLRFTIESIIFLARVVFGYPEPGATSSFDKTTS